MSRAQHTPGAWTIPDGGITPEIWSDDGPIAKLHECGDVAEADARLIAAAPDMLAALKAAEGAVILAIAQSEDRAALDNLDAIADRVRAAIAKAEGH